MSENTCPLDEIRSKLLATPPPLPPMFPPISTFSLFKFHSRLFFCHMSPYPLLIFNVFSLQSQEFGEGGWGEASKK
jgi:hypothetical protein